jgi:threonine synthase
MDIQISSNLERLLFELEDRDGAAVARLLRTFREKGSTEISERLHGRLVEGWASARFDDDQVLMCIAEEADKSGIVLDPHSAVGVLAARACRPDPAVPVVALATAHPAKFPDAVEKATGVRPVLPDRLSDLLDRSERMTNLPNDLSEVETFVEEHVRAV